MLPVQRLQVAALSLLLVLLGARAEPQRIEDIANHIATHGVPDRTANGNFNVFFIPAYRLNANKSAAQVVAAPTPAPSRPPSLRLDPHTSARLLTAALTAAARLTASPSPPPPAHTTPAPTLPPPRAGHSAQLVRRAPQDGDEAPPSQHHDAHILVTLQNYGAQQKVAVSQPIQPPPQGAIGYGSVQHFNNYPAVNGHVPAHFSHLPYYGHFPVAATGALSAPSAVSGPGGGLLYTPLPRFSAAASALDLVSSSPLAVNPGTLLGTTGPLYATPGHPVGTIGVHSPVGPLGTLGNAAASAHEAASTTNTEATTMTPAVTTPPVTSSMGSSPTPSSPASSETTVVTSNPKDDAEVEPRTTPFKQSFEFGRSDSSRRLNLTEEVEVTGSAEDASSRETTTPPPPTAATQQTSPATNSATEIKDLNAESPTPQSPPTSARAEPPSQGPFPGPYDFPRGPGSLHGVPGVPGVPGVYPTGIPLGGYRPPDYRFRSNPYHDPRFNYQPSQQQQPQQQQQGTPSSAPTARNPNFPGNFDPFYGAYIPGFAPGYPFGELPHGAHAPQNNPNDLRGSPYGSQPPPFGPPYGPFVPGRGSAGPAGPAGGAPGGTPGGAGGSSAGGSGGSSQEASDEDRDGRPPPARLQYEPTGSGEDGQLFRQQQQQPQQQQQQQQQQLQHPFSGFGGPGQLPHLPFSSTAFQATGPGGNGGAFAGPNAFHRPTQFGQPQSATNSPSPGANFNNQFLTNDFLGRQRLPSLYSGPTGGGQQQLRSPLFSPQQGISGVSELGGLPGGRGGSLFSPQQPFSFNNNPLFYPTGADVGDVEPRQSKLSPYSVAAESAAQATADQERLVAAKLDVQATSAVGDLFSSVVDSLGSVSAGHHVQRRRADSPAPVRIGYNSAANR